MDKVQQKILFRNLLLLEAEDYETSLIKVILLPLEEYCVQITLKVKNLVKEVGLFSNDDLL